MAIDRVRSVIRTYVHEDDLKEFEVLCESTDDLWSQLDLEEDPKEAWNLALAWSTSMLRLAGTEHTLLSKILPVMQQELDAFNPAVKDLNERTTEAQELTRDLGGGSVGPQPQNIDHEAKRKELRKRKSMQKHLLTEQGVEGHAISAKQVTLRAAIGKVNLSIRTLAVVIDTRVPEDFANLWAESMDPENRNKADKLRKFRARQTKMRLRPQHDFEKDKADHVTRVAARS